MTPPANASQMNWLTKTPSERELDRLQKIYGQLQNKNEVETPIWRTSVRLSCAAANRISSPRCSIARVLGNQYSKQNMAAGAPVTPPPYPQNVANNTQLVLKGRSYGNQRSLQNVQNIQVQRQHQQQRCDDSFLSISNTPASFGNYYNLKNRLILLDEQRAALMQLYGRERFLNEYTDLLQQCWHFEQLHKNVLPFAQVKIQAMLAEMKNCTVSNVVEKTVVNRPATPVVKAVRQNIPSTRNSTKSPDDASTKTVTTKSSAKIVPKTTTDQAKKSVQSTGKSGLVKRKACSNLVKLAETLSTTKCGQSGSLQALPENVAVGGLNDDGISNYSLHHAPSAFERETNLLALSAETLIPYLHQRSNTESERIALENALSQSNLSEKVDDPEFISTEKQNLASDPPIIDLPKIVTHSDTEFKNHQQELLEYMTIAPADSKIHSSVVDQDGLGSDRLPENPEREADNELFERDQVTLKPAENKNAITALADSAVLPKQSNPSNPNVTSNSFVRNLVNQFSNIM